MEATLTAPEERVKAPMQPLPEVASRRARWTLSCPRLTAALLSAGLMYISFYPLAWGWVGWVALAPLLFLVRADARPRNIYFAAWVAGLAFYWPVLQWMRVADYRMYFCWALLATYCSWYVPLAVYLLRKLDRETKLPLVITVPAVWAGLEYVRSFMFTGFPWYYLGHTQHNFLPLIQIADLAGVYSVSLLVAAANAWIFELLYAQPTIRKLFQLACVSRPQQPTDSQNPLPTSTIRPGLAFQGFAIFVLIAGSLFYGFWRLDQAHFAAGPRIALLQGNVDQRLRNDADLNPDARTDAIKQYKSLSAIAAAETPDLVVWPETSFLIPWVDISSRLPGEKLRPQWADEALQSRTIYQAWVKHWPGDNLFGVNTFFMSEECKEIRYNSALLMKSDGQSAQRYDKIHRLPFGEYVPLREWLPFMNYFAPYDHDYSIRSGDEQTRFQVGNYRYGVLICYEDTDSVLARQLVTSSVDGPAADFIINMSNESWFDDTCEHEEHLAVCRFRAIECRRALARAVNMGISAVIDGNGRVLQPRSVWQRLPGQTASNRAGDFQVWEITPDEGDVPELPVSKWAEFKKVPGVLTAVIPIDRRESPYARWGDWLPVSCWVVLGLGVTVPYLRRRARPATALS